MGLFDTIKGVEDNIMKVIKEGADLAARGGGTEAERTQWEQHVRDVCKNGIQSFNDEARKELERHTTKHLMDRGASPEEARKWASQTLQKVKDLNEKVHPKVVAGEKWLMLQLGALLVFGGWALTTITGYREPPNAADKMYGDMQHQAAVRAEETENLEAIQISEDDFNMLIGGLVKTAPPQIKSTPDAQPASAALGPFPPAVAAESKQPVAVTVTTPTGTQTITTTIGQVYTNAPPPVRRRIDQQAPPPPPMAPVVYGSPDDCFHTHCLSGGTAPVGKSFTVGGTPFGSATFRY